jgi:hypothetical protein
MLVVFIVFPQDRIFLKVNFSLFVDYVPSIIYIIELSHLQFEFKHVILQSCYDLRHLNVLIASEVQKPSTS